MADKKAGLADLVIGLSLAALVMAWPGYQDLAALGRFAASWVILVHWHFGVGFVLEHLGPPERLWKALGESLALFCLLAMTQALRSPLAWYLLNAAAYGVALARYWGLDPARLSPGLAHYVRWKALIEVLAIALNLGGACLAWAWPALELSLAWVAFGLNLVAAYALSEVLRLYDVRQVIGSFSPARS